MENTMMVRSKALVQPSTARRIFVKTLWVCVIFMAISAVVGFFASGFQISVLFSFSLAAIIVSRFTNLPQNIPHYEFDLAEISFEPSTLNISYQNGKTTSVSVLYSDITQAEHSEQLHCFKLSFAQNVKGASNGTYHLLYMEDEWMAAFAKMLEKSTNLSVQYLK